MAAFHGKSGKVIWDAADADDEIVLCKNWSADVSSDVAECTTMGDTWKSYKPGFLDWTATVECYFDSGGLTVPLATGGAEAIGEATPAKLELWLDETGGSIKVLYGSAVCNGISVVVGANDIAQVTYTFQGTDTLTYGTDTPTY